MVVYIYSSSWILALGSHDSTLAEKQVTVVKPEQIHKMTIIFSQQGQKLSF